MRISLICWIVILLVITQCSPVSFLDVDCPKSHTANAGQHIEINCTSNENITYAALMKYDLNYDSYHRIVYNTGEQKKEKGRYSLTINATILNIMVKNASIKDAGDYKIQIFSGSIYRDKLFTIDIQAHYRVPQICYNNRSMELICYTSGGCTESQIHWFDTYDTNWTKSAKTTVERTSDGLFSITSILPLKSSSIMPSYRCYLTSEKKETTVHMENINNDKLSGNSKPFLFILVPLCCVAVTLLLGYLYYKRRHVAPFQRREERRNEQDEVML